MTPLANRDFACAAGRWSASAAVVASGQSPPTSWLLPPLPFCALRLSGQDALSRSGGTAAGGTRRMGSPFSAALPLLGVHDGGL